MRERECEGESVIIIEYLKVKKGIKFMFECQAKRQRVCMCMS